MKAFIAGLVVGTVFGVFVGFVAWHFYQRMPVTMSLVNTEVRAAALSAISNSTSIVLEEAEAYSFEGIPSKVIHTVQASSTTKAALESLFSNNETQELPRWLRERERRMVTACFIPHHRLRCTNSEGHVTDIYICFWCSNFAVKQRNDYYRLSALYRQELKVIFTSQGFEIKKSPGDKAREDNL